MSKKKMLVVTVFVLMTLVLAFQANAQVGPVLRVSLTNYDPAPASPGDTVDVWIRIANDGDTNANNVAIKFVDSYPFKLSTETERIVDVGSVFSGSEYLLNYKVRVDGSAPEGAQDLLFQYKLGGDVEFTQTSKISINIRSTDSPVTITKVRVKPEMISPGGQSTVTISVKNMAKASTVRDVSVNLQLTPVVSATSILIDVPFVPINSGNKKVVDKIKPGQTAEFEFELAAYPDAESRLYKLPLSLSYTDDAGVSYDQTALIGLEVNSKPELIVKIEDSELNSEKASGEIEFSVINKGINDIKLMTFKLEESGAYEVLSTSNEVYIGNIDSDDFETVKFRIKLNSSKDINVPVKINYKDSLNNNYEQSFSLNLKIREPEEPNNGSSIIIIIVIILVVVVAFLIYRNRRKKKKE